MDYKFDISKLKGVLRQIRDWMKDHRFPSKLLFYSMGIISTIWFLIRVIPKPSRATYPCVRAAAPLMSGFVVYLLTLGGFTIILRKARKKLQQSRYILAGVLAGLAIFGFVFSQSFTSVNLFAGNEINRGPDDAANQPMGEGHGVNPGRVVWVWNPQATNENCINTYDFFKPENTNQGVVNRMVADGIKKLSGKTNLRESWDTIFQYFNSKKDRGDKGYSAGEKIFIKINQGTANGLLSWDDIDKGFYISSDITEGEIAKSGGFGACEAYPNVILEIIRELVYVVGVAQKDISIGDPISHIYGHNYEIWATEFPEVQYVDRSSSNFGRTLINRTAEPLVFYSDKSRNDKLYDVIKNADYLINIANLKPHSRAGVSFTAKNHFGSHARRSAMHLHYSLPSPISQGRPTNNGYHKYRVLVDLMGSKYLGENTLLYLVDGLYGGGSNETRVPVKYFMSPFNDDWSNSVFLSQDQVALESVCYDFLRAEWDGINQHSDANNRYESFPNVNGVDDYLHQAADRANWPDGIIYDPDNSGKPLASLGVHEHWNNPVKKQYARNLGENRGIELVSIPDYLVGGDNISISSQKKEDINVLTGALDDETITKSSSTNLKFSPINKSGDNVNIKINSVTDQHFEGEIKAQKFYSIAVDNYNFKWFLTEYGILRFDGDYCQLYNNRGKLDSMRINDLDCKSSTYGRELLLATSGGLVSINHNLNKNSEIIIYDNNNSDVLSNNIISICSGKNSVQWIGTDLGISAHNNGKWLTNSYFEKYPKELFEMFPITDMSASVDGDTLYIATKGAGVSRLYKDGVDAISGASEYLQWGPIEIPSDNVYSVCITSEGIQWFGTDAGVARHIGFNTLDKWTVFDENDGLVNNFVQTICEDKKGNIWFGTKGGVSVFNNSGIVSFTKEDGLTGNNVLCISTDKEGVVWLGTDSGVTSYWNNEFIRYQ